MDFKNPYREALQPHLPPEALRGISAYMANHYVLLRIVPGRQSKLGDYRYPSPKRPRHRISINGDLNPYMFLYVILHEMAHLDCWLQKQQSEPPHGRGWQRCFAENLRTYLHCFPTDARPALLSYISTMPLKHERALIVEGILRRLSLPLSALLLPVMNDLLPGDLFTLPEKPELQLRAIEKVRTRWKCEDVASGTTYVVHGLANVLPTGDAGQNSPLYNDESTPPHDGYAPSSDDSEEQ